MLLERIQDDFLEQIHVSISDALLIHNLAPLSARRSISMLGLLHRTQLGIAPPMLCNFSLVQLLRCLNLLWVLPHAIVGKLRV